MKSSGINGMVMYLAIPIIVIFIYVAFSYKMLTFWTLFIINYFVMELQKENLMPLPASLPNELLELILIAIAIIDLRDTHFENLANLMMIGVLGWCAFCVLEVINNTCGLGVNVMAWFTGARLMAFQILYAVVVFGLYINSPKRVNQVMFVWAILTLWAVFWVWKQQNIGFTDAENAWLNNYAYRTHRVNGILRYWSVFNDAAIFGIHMAAAATAFFILAITNNIKKYKLFFGIVGVLSTWAMFASGTRTAIFCMIAGFCVFLVLSKSVKIIASVTIFLLLFVGMLMFTTIGQGNVSGSLIELLIGVFIFGAGIQTRLEIQRSGNSYEISVPFYERSKMAKAKKFIDEAVNRTEERRDVEMAAQMIVDSMKR